jgi:hypothetical protein
MATTKINTIQIQHKDEAAEEILVDGSIINDGLTINFHSLVSSAQRCGNFFYTDM